MNLQEILDSTRVELLDDPENVDNPEDNLWTNPELIRHANSAVKEVCRRTLALIDDETLNLAVINVVVEDAVPPVSTDYNVNAGSGFLTLSPLILAVKEVWFNGKRLEKIDKGYLRNAYRDWRSRTATAPTHYLEENNRLRLFPLPTVGGTLELTVARLPLVGMSNFDDVPEIPEELHDGLKHWIAHQAYLKPDSQTLNKNASAEHLNLFTGIYGPAISARDAMDNRNGKTTTVNLRRFAL